jgi:hypothetical protein
MSVSFRVTGTKEMRGELHRIAARAPRAIERAVYRFAQVEMTESKKRVPVRYGILKNSGHVEKPKNIGGRISVELGYGGAAEAYAIYVHEDLEAMHENGEAKFLESVLNESGPHFAARVGRDVAEELGIR